MSYPITFGSEYGYATNYQNRLNEVVQTIFRNKLLLGLMQMNGRITPAKGGEMLEWVVHMRLPKPRGYTGEGVPEYNTPDNKRTARLPWGAYHHGLKLDRIKLQVNRGPTAFVNIYEDALQEVRNAYEQRFTEYFYQDGDNPPEGEPKPLIGFYTWLGKYSTSSAAGSQGYQGKVRLVDGSYGGISMNLGAESSAWVGDDGYDAAAADYSSKSMVTGNKWWPSGQGDAAYDFWHPLIVNTTASTWGSDPGFDAVYCEEQLDFGLMFSRRVAQGDKGPINLLITGTTNQLTIRKRYASTYRTTTMVVQDNAKGGQGVQNGPGLQFGRPIHEVNGAYICDDYDIPNTMDVIGLNLNTISYHPCFPYSETGQIQFMEPYEGEIPGGGGKLIGGFNLGQLMIDTPRNSVLWSPLS